MLRVSLLGNMGADPEVRYSQKGTQLVSFRVAVNQVRTGPDGERQENTEWFRIKVANRQTEFVQRLSKGTRVLVIGRLDIGHFQGKDGEPRTSFDVWADEIQAMSSRGMGVDAESAQDVDAEGAEPVAAGVSSLGGGPARANGPNGNGNSPNGNGTRARPTTRGPGDTPSGARAEDLEDLPF